MRFLKESLEHFEKSRGITPKDSISQQITDKQGIFQSFLPNYHGNPYILSLCSDKDSLAMWRFYGDNGQGIAIGLDINALDKYCQPFKERSLTQCLYGRTNRKKAEKFWENNYHNFIFGKGVIKIEGGKEESDAILHELSSLCFSAKSRYYNVEKEHRLCILGDWSKEPRVVGFKKKKDGSLKSYYYKCLLNKEALTHITLGPCTDIDDTRDRVRSLLSGHGISPKIVPSQISYRQVR